MALLVDLLGQWLVGKDGYVKTVDAVANKKAIGLYFSANWCLPCDAFTPLLVEKYENILEAKGLEIVFVSSDKDEHQTQVYHAGMPWLSLPYKDRRRGALLSRKYKITGIPSLVILDSNGILVTTDGKCVVEGEDVDPFPWYESVLSCIGGTLASPDDALIGKEAIENKIVGFFFSAHWCPYARVFTKVLARCYELVKEKHPNFEVVFVSSDRDEQSFKEYFKTMPWLALPYARQEESDALSDNYNVVNMPTLVMINTVNGAVINEDACTEIELDPEGKRFPWAQEMKSSRRRRSCWPFRRD